MRPHLTHRETDILKGLVDRLSDKEIAKRLFISVSTVQWYNRQLYDKLHVKNRREAATYAIQHGLLDATETAISQDKHNLPASTTPFIGRIHEQTLIKSLLESDHRLITILAPGGMGKTRLAVEILRDCLTSFHDGAYFIPLQSIADISQIMTAVGTQLNIPMVSTERSPEQQVLDTIKSKQMLLVIDNYEHLLDGAHYVHQILEQAYDVKIIVTSRERLNLQSETIVRLSGLSHDANEFTSDAVTLLVKHIQRLKPDFELQANHHKAIDQICNLTEGMPLALMLAATWSNTLTLDQIADEITQGIGFLQNASGDLPRRHQAIRSVFEPTWKRLSDAERRAFSRLSIFAGGCTLEAATQVTDANIIILRSLVNKALITLTDNGRYEIHELLRQYAEEKLRLLDDYQSAKQAHAKFYAELMQWYGNNFFKVGGFNRVEPEMDNIRAMWWHLVEHEQWRYIEITMIACRRVLNTSVNHQEIARWFQFAVDALEQSKDFKQEQALYGCLLACLVYVYNELRHSDRQQMHKYAYQILDPCELNLYSAYMFLNLAIDVTDDTNVVLKTFNRVVPIFKQANFSNGVTIAHIMRMINYMDYDLDLALAHGLEGIAIAEQGGDLAGGSWAMGIVGEIMLRRYQYEDALTYGLQYYKNFRRIKLLAAAIHASWLIFKAYFMLGENDNARSVLEKSIEHCQHYGFIKREIDTLSRLCEFYLELHDHKSAEHHFQLMRICIETSEIFEVNVIINDRISQIESWLALEKGNYKQAGEIYQRTVMMAQSHNDVAWIRETKPLHQYIYAQVLIAQQQPDEAIPILIDAIRTMPRDMFYKQFQAIMTYAQLLDMPQQVSLLTFVANHAGTAPLDRQIANGLVKACSSTMDHESFSQAVKIGQQYELQTVIDNLP